jgi:tetratricopeptide (TPR) repeat protein
MNDTSILNQLDSSIAEKTRRLCQQGYQLFDKGDIKAALRCFYSAWTLLPKPQTQWEEAGWVLTALGDAYFANSDFDNGREALMSALHCPKALGNPIIHLRLGQCLFELGQQEQAALHFHLVRDHGGKDLFIKEAAKYRDHQ